MTLSSAHHTSCSLGNRPIARAAQGESRPIIVTVIGSYSGLVWCCTYCSMEQGPRIGTYYSMEQGPRIGTYYSMEQEPRIEMHYSMEQGPRIVL